MLWLIVFKSNLFSESVPLCCMQSLVAASAVLLAGAERLKKSNAEVNKKGISDFHNELSTLRKNWRLKKVSTNIVGDLSYRSGMSQKMLGVKAL